MRRVLIALLLLVMSMPACFSQQRGASKIDLSKFPEVSLVWNENDSNPIKQSAVQFTVDGRKVPFEWTAIDTVVDNSRPKSVLILWEDMSSHFGQNAFTANVLKEFFKGKVNKGDSFNIVTFNRDKGDGHFLKPLLEKGSSKPSELSMVVESFQPVPEQFSPSPLCANVNQAIVEGLKMLQSQPADNIKVIVLFTAGFNMATSGAPKDFGVTQARQQDVPVYVVKFPLNGDNTRKDIEGVEEATNGLLIVPESITDVEGTAALLTQAYEDMARRHYGKDYRLKFKLDDEERDKNHDLVLTMRGVAHPISITTPAYSIKEWISDNLVLSIVIGVVILSLLGLLVFFMVSRLRKHKSEIEKIRMEHAEANQTLHGQLQSQMEAYEQLKNERKAEDMESKKAAYHNMLRLKHMRPRLEYMLNGQLFSASLDDAITTIGRKDDNDIVIPEGTVSRQHAIITFDGNEFIIENVSKANKTIVNGQFINKYALKGGDKIGMGAVVLKFYL